MIKKTSILFIIFILAIWFWVSVEPWIANPIKFADFSIWLQPLILLIVLASFVGLALMLINEKWLKFLVFGIVSLPAMVLFGLNPFFIVALAITFLFFLSAVRAIRQETEERTKINVGMIMKRGLPYIISPILIVVSFAYYLSPSVQESAKKNQLPPTITQLVEKTIDGFLGQEINQLPAVEKGKVKNQVINEVMKKITDFVYPYLRFLPPALAFGLFLVLQGLSFIFVRLALWLAMLIFYLFRKFNFIKIEEYDAKAERIIV